MKEFTYSFLGGLRNEEFPKFFNQLCSILEVESVEDIYVKECLQEVNSHQDELKFVMNMRNPHPLTAIMDKQIVKRKTYLVSLRGKIFASLKSPFETEREASIILAAWMNKHCKGKLYVPSIIVHGSMVDNMMQDHSLSSDIQEAMDSLVLSPVFDSIVSISNSIDENFMARNKQQAADVRKAFLIRNAAYKSLRKFFRATELGLSLEKTGDHFFLDYSREIDKLLEAYRVRFISRNTRRKNAAKAAANQEGNPENGEQNGGNVQPMGENPAIAGRSRTFNAMSMNGMDLQNGFATQNGDKNETLAMNGNVTNGGATNGTYKKTDDLSAGNGGLTNSVLEPWTMESTTNKQNGADGNDHSDRES